MNSFAADFRKLLREPFLWVAGVVVAVPVLAPGMLLKVRETLFFAPETAFTEPKSAENMVALNTSASASPSLKANAGKAVEPRVAFRETATKQPSTKVPAAIEPDPGALTWESLDDKTASSEFQTGAQGGVSKQSENEGSEPDSFDFLFGEEPPSEPKSVKKDAAEGNVSERKLNKPKSQQMPDSSKAPTKRESESFQQPDWSFEDSPSQPNQTQSNRSNLEQPSLVEPFGSDGGYHLTVDTGYDWWSQPALDPLWSDRFTKMTSLDAVVFAAMQNAPTVTLVNTEPQIAQTMVTEADAQFDWSTFVDASWNDVDRAVVSLLDTGTAGGRFLQQQLLVEGGLQKRTRAGGHLRVGQALQRTDNNSTFLSPPDQATTQLLLDYRQPLLKGAGRQVNQSQIMLAQIGLEASQEDSQVQLQQFLVDVVSQYWRLYQARGNLLQKIRSANRAEQLLEKLSVKGNSAETQRLIYRVQATATSRQTELIRAQNAVAAAQESLLTLTHGSGMVDLDSIELVPIEAPATLAIPHSIQQVTETAMQNRAEIRVALAAIKASAVRQQLALNDLKPQLDAVISTFVSGVSGNKDVGRAYEDSFSNNPSYAVGISFEVPIGRRASNARLQRQELENRRLHQQLQQVLGNVRLDARLAYRDVQSHAAEYQQFQIAMEQASKELQSIEEQAGTMLADSQSAGLFIHDVLQSQARLANTEQQMLNSQTELSIALVRLKRATGQLLQARAFAQPDGYVQQATYEEDIVANHYQLERQPMPVANRVPQFQSLPPMRSASTPTLATPLDSTARRLPAADSGTYR